MPRFNELRNSDVMIGGAHPCNDALAMGGIGGCQICDDYVEEMRLRGLWHPTVNPGGRNYVENIDRDLGQAFAADQCDTHLLRFVSRSATRADMAGPADLFSVPNPEPAPIARFTCACCRRQTRLTERWQRSPLGGMFAGAEVCSSCVQYHFVILSGERYDDNPARYYSDECVSYQDTGEWVLREVAAEHGWQAPDGVWYSQEQDFSRELLGYTACPIAHCKAPTDYGKRLVFGFECEMECGDNDTSAVLSEVDGGNTGPDYICKSDGSLSNGIELVSVPYSLEQHRERNWETTFAAFRAAGCRVDSTCGMHIHVNRRALSPLVLGKMLCFMGADETQNFLDEIAGRRQNSYCHREEHSLRRTVKYAKGQGTEKYVALNLKRNTAEFRLFRGTLKTATVLKNIEFCHALTVYMRECAIGKLADVQAFLNWIKPRAKVYPNLSAFLIEKGRLPQTKVRQLQQRNAKRAA